MTNLRLQFSYPWLLLLIIPAIALTLLPYFKLAKKYRRTRNRVISVVLHSIIMTLAILMLSGLTFHYEMPNKDNELLLLVDTSYSSRDTEDDKQDFVQQVIRQCSEDFKVGVVKFGYDQVYAAELSNDPTEVFEQYVQSVDPDTSATDVEAALNYASSLLTKPKTSKIVLISDGIETDGDAFDVISRIAATGIKVDTMHYPNKVGAEAQIVGVTLPEEGVQIEQEFRMQIAIESNVTGGDQLIALTVSDNDTMYNPLLIELDDTITTVPLTYKFTTPGLHRLQFSIAYDGDTMEQNNSYQTYMYLHVADNILIIEKYEGESSSLESILTTDGQYKVKTLSIEEDLDQLPTDANELCDYEQVVLVNIANSDMPEGFDELLNDYVYNYGGGMFTVGGTNDVKDGVLVPHAYNRNDMYGSLYQEMLPVQVVNYAPPVAVMILIDSSGSMGSGEGSPLEAARDGALACVDLFSSFDYCGVATFQDHYEEQLKVIPVSQRDKIEDAITNWGNEGTGGTIFQEAIEGAGAALAAADVARRHIILVTDGMPGDTGKYEDYIVANAKNGITMSVVCVKGTADSISKMEEDAALGGGKCYDIQNVGNLAEAMQKDIIAEAIEEIAYGEEFYPTIGDRSNVVAGITQKDIPALTGYYGTRLKEGAIAPLEGKYVPIYAEWDYGNGTVGSFMSDLNGTWSEQFINELTGKQLICAMVASLFPGHQLETRDIIVKMHEDNYTTQLSVYTEKGKDETIEVSVVPISPDAAGYYQDKTIEVTSDDGGTRYDFDITFAGIYQIRVVKKGLNEAGETIVLAETSMYKTFSYSEEYDAFPDPETTGEPYLRLLAEDGRGLYLSDIDEVFDSFSKTVNKVFDPRLLFAIIAIVLFLLDIAVRKFKFKWIHEIIRDRRAKKEYVKK